MKGKKQMPGYYGKNIVQHAQKRFFRRKMLERENRRGERDLCGRDSGAEKERLQENGATAQETDRVG